MGEATGSLMETGTIDSMRDADDEGPLLSEVQQSKGTCVAAPPPVVSDGGNDEAKERKRTNEAASTGPAPLEIARRNVPENVTLVLCWRHCLSGMREALPATEGGRCGPWSGRQDAVGGAATTTPEEPAAATGRAVLLRNRRWRHEFEISDCPRGKSPGERRLGAARERSLQNCV
jgi:hypothetical protein